MPNQDQRPAALGTGVPHDGVEVVQEGAEIWRVPTLAAAAAVAAVVHAIDGRAQWRKPLRQVSVAAAMLDRKSTRLNSSHQIISYAVFCLKKKTLVILSH